MSAFNNRFNKDDIAERNVIAGILHVLHNAITYEYVYSESKVEKVEIPFYYSLSGDERFLMDNFLNEIDVSAAETQYDKVPRAVIFLDSSTIDTESLTNPHVRLKEVVEEKENEGDKVAVLNTYYSLYSSIPITMNFSCKIKVATHRDLLIVSELLKRNFFRNKRFYYDFRGIRVPGNIAFPESFERENPIEYSFDGIDRSQELLLSLEVSTFLLSYNEDTRIHARKRMASFDSNLNGKDWPNK